MNTNTQSTTLRHIADELVIVALELDFVANGIAALDVQNGDGNLDGPVFLLLHLKEKLQKLSAEAGDANPLPTAGGLSNV